MTLNPRGEWEKHYYLGLITTLMSVIYAEDDMQQAVRKYLTALEAGDADKAALLFTADGWVESPFLGRVSVRDYVTKVAAASSWTSFREAALAIVLKRTDFPVSNGLCVSAHLKLLIIFEQDITFNVSRQIGTRTSGFELRIDVAPVISTSAPLERNSILRAIKRGDFSPLHPLLNTLNTRCGNAGGCQRRECNTAGGTPRFNEEDISHSSPIAAAVETVCHKFLVMPGHFFEMCAANTPA